MRGGGLVAGVVDDGQRDRVAAGRGVGVLDVDALGGGAVPEVPAVGDDLAVRVVRAGPGQGVGGVAGVGDRDGGGRQRVVGGGEDELVAAEGQAVHDGVRAGLVDAELEAQRGDHRVGVGAADLDQRALVEGLRGVQGLQRLAAPPDAGPVALVLRLEDQPRPGLVARRAVEVDQQLVGRVVRGVVAGHRRVEGDVGLRGGLGQRDLDVHEPARAGLGVLGGAQVQAVGLHDRGRAAADAGPAGVEGGLEAGLVQRGDAAAGRRGDAGRDRAEQCGGAEGESPCGDETGGALHGSPRGRARGGRPARPPSGRSSVGAGAPAATPPDARPGDSRAGGRPPRRHTA